MTIYQIIPNYVHGIVNIKEDLVGVGHVQPLQVDSGWNVPAFPQSDVHRKTHADVLLKPQSYSVRSQVLFLIFVFLLIRDVGFVIMVLSTPKREGADCVIPHLTSFSSWDKVCSFLFLC